MPPDADATRDTHPGVAARPARAGLTRRRFLRWGVGGGTAAVAGLGGMAYTTCITPFAVRWVRRVTHLPADHRWAGRVIAQLSDLHLGMTDAGYLAAELDRVVGERPDLIVVTGDVLNDSRSGEVELAAPMLSRLKPRRTPVLVCLGNHDYGHGKDHLAVAERLKGELEAIGCRVLIDRRIDLDGLAVLGLDDFWSERWDGAAVRALVADAAAAGGGLVLTHNPDTADLPIWAGFRGTLLSGHTHGGQVCLPLAGPPVLPVSNRSYVRGVYPQAPGRELYINPGIGYSQPVRFNAPPEVTWHRVRVQ